MYVYDSCGSTVYFESRYSSCFILTLKGKIQFSFGDDVYITDENNWLFIPKGANYINRCLEDAESIVINFQTTSENCMPCRLNSIGRRNALSFYESINSRSAGFSTEEEYYILGQVYTLAYELFKGAGSQSEKEIITYKAQQYLKTNYSSSSLRISDAAKHCNISPVYLRRLFAEKYKKSPFEVLTDIRMRQAHSMTLEKRNVKEIASAVGYSDIYQFSRAYKRYFGYSPSNMR